MCGGGLPYSLPLLAPLRNSHVGAALRPRVRREHFLVRTTGAVGEVPPTPGSFALAACEQVAVVALGPVAVSGDAGVASRPTARVAGQHGLSVGALDVRARASRAGVARVHAKVDMCRAVQVHDVGRNRREARGCDAQRRAARAQAWPESGATAAVEHGVPVDRSAAIEAPVHLVVALEADAEITTGLGARFAA